MQDNKLFAAFGVGAMLNVVDGFIPGAEPFLRFTFLILQIVVTALTAALLLKKMRGKKK